MSSGITNQAFNEVGRKISQHSLNISLKLKGKDGTVSQRRLSMEDELPEHKQYLADTEGIAVELSKISKPRWMKYLINSISLIAPLVYFAFASLYWIKSNEQNHCPVEWCKGYGMLIIILILAYGGILYYFLLKKYLVQFFTKLPLIDKKKDEEILRGPKYYIKIFIPIAVVIAIVIFILIDTIGSRNRLISLGGVICILLFGFIFSKHPRRVNWRTVIWGLIMQFTFGILTIRWKYGRLIFDCISQHVASFLGFAKSGASFVFSDKLVNDKVFAFSALPVIFFFSFMIQVLYYLGVMQWIIKKSGWFLHAIMGTTVCESINSAANIFIGMTESPLLIKPYISQLTTSEIHAVMCSGFATVSGTVLAAYIEFGAKPANLITASVMAAPAALCFAKLFYPETEKSVTTFKNIKLEKSQDTSIIDAATKGALAGIPLVLGIIANIIAFVSAIAFLNTIFSWFGELLGYSDMNFEWILSQVFMPLSWLMGVPWNECQYVGKLIGLKTVVNEFIAYKELGVLKKANVLSPRTEAIATFAICGFSNPGSIGIMIGGLSTMAPEKRNQITSVVLRSFIAGSLVCFLTASIAGVLMDDTFFIETSVNSTLM